ncbi:MAG: LytTR family transcriptional regulator [Bacteroidales bacterium]|nr:LytTR family transcriptional regulator [Bacteroidales bacterium]MBN2820984.1 LytTR family transcriptional regulator [Bacteroidales bacterium]
MLIWEKKIPTYLVHKESIVRTTIFTGLFALAFINFYAPFNVEKWYQPTNEFELFFYSSLVILVGMLVIVLSRIIMFQVSKKVELTYLIYAIWIAAEIISMAAVYSVFAKFALDDRRFFYEIIEITFKNTLLILLLPYTVLWLYFAYREKTKELEEYSQTGILKGHPDKMIPFYDEKGKLKFSVINDDILYIEASDNYVSIYYVTNEKTAKYMVRNTLKNLEEKLKNIGFIRCHRSFLVNFNKVKLLKREKDGLFIELNADNQITLPVSKTYVTGIIESFSESSL